METLARPHRGGSIALLAIIGFLVCACGCSQDNIYWMPRPIPAVVDSKLTLEGAITSRDFDPMRYSGGSPLMIAGGSLHEQWVKVRLIYIITEPVIAEERVEFLIRLAAERPVQVDADFYWDEDAGVQEDDHTSDLNGEVRLNRNTLVGEGPLIVQFQVSGSVAGVRRERKGLFAVALTELDP